jgi:valyl-tRNA synthetase
MIFSGLAYTGTLPFTKVVIHGIVRDSQGRKMSKSLGNGVDPLEVIDKYGADALRFMLVQGSSPGNDLRYSDDKIIAMRNFTNKIWNASRFLLMNMTIDHVELPSELSLEDKWILSKLNTVINDITYNLENFDMGVAAQKVYDFIWNTFCDWYIELSKNRLSGTDEVKKKNVENVLAYVLINILKLLHPFMPYITEEIYQALPHEEGFLMMQSWPMYDEKKNYPADEMRMEKIMDAVRAVRECRSEHKVPNSRKTQITILTDNPNQYAEAEEFLTRLAGASQVIVTSSETDISSGMITVATSDAKLCMPLRELIDIEAERLRIQKELAKAHKELEFASSKLENQEFINKAPEKVISDIKDKAAKANALIQNLQDMLTDLGD